MNTPLEIGRDEIRAKVEAAPWAFFHLPVECWTNELALIAWRQVGFVLSRVPSDFSPEQSFEGGKWEQFVELLLGNAVVAGLATSYSANNWASVVNCIDAYLASKDVNDTYEELPGFLDCEI